MPLFQQYHLLLALLEIRERGYAGRKQLAKEMGVGEGSIRSILGRLKRAGYVRTERKGNSLTPRGHELLGSLGLTVLSITGGEISVGECDVAVVISGYGDRVLDGFTQRDAAVRAGARGATTLLYRKGGLYFPDGERMRGEEGLMDQLMAGMEARGLMDGDVVIIGTADQEMAALKGALAAALDMM